MSMYWAAMLIMSVFSASMKSSIISSAKKYIITVVTRKNTTVIFIADTIPSFTRSIFFAPMFCPQYVAMATPMFSYTQVKMYLALAAAVNAATYIVPRALFALCSIITPMAVIENCMPIGTPFMSSLPVILSLYARSRPVGMSIFMRFFMYVKHSAEANACDAIVARPAPSTPSPMPMMRAKSSAMLSSEAAMRK